MKVKKIERVWVIALAIVIASVVLGLLFKFSTAVELDQNGVPMVGRKAPSFEFDDASGQKSSLRQLEGNAVLLNFWAVWCEPCLVEMPSLVALERHYASRGLTLLAIDIEGRRDDIRETLSGMELPQNLIVSFNKSQLRSYGVQAIPLSILIDSMGVVAKIYTGPREWMSVESLREIDGVLDRKR